MVRLGGIVMGKLLLVVLIIMLLVLIFSFAYSLFRINSAYEEYEKMQQEIEQSKKTCYLK